MSPGKDFERKSPHQRKLFSGGTLPASFISPRFLFLSKLLFLSTSCVLVFIDPDI